jgi:hypothetical protein
MRTSSRLPILLSSLAAITFLALLVDSPNMVGAADPNAAAATSVAAQVAPAAAPAPATPGGPAAQPGSPVSATASTAAPALPPIVEVSPTIQVHAGIGSGDGQIALADGPGPVPPSEGPSAIAVDAKDHLYVLDLFNSRLLHYDEKGALVETLPVPAGETGSNLDYLSDFALQPDGFVFLNQTRKKVLYFTLDGKFAREVDLSASLALPETMTFSPSGLLYIRDDEGKLVGLDKDGKIVARLNGYDFMEFASPDNFLYTWGEETDATKDIIGTYPEEMADASTPAAPGTAPVTVKSKQPKLIARLLRNAPQFELMAWEFLGTDAKGNFYVSSTEKIAKDTETVEITINRVAPDGTVLARMKTPPPTRIRCFPEREMIVSPAGDIWALAGDEKYTEFRIVRFKF